MQYIFFGTPRFADIILEKLINADLIPAMVVCNPDKPVGRKKIITPPPVKTRITNLESRIKNKIKIIQPEKLDIALFSIRDSLFDFAIVAAYSKIIPKEIIALLPQGIIGVHPSLLPKYRGPSPIQQAILDGENETGVTLYLLDEKVDHGAIIATNNLQLTTNDTYVTLEEKLARMAGELLVGILPKYVDGKIEAIEQNHEKATFTKKFKTEDGFVDPVELAEARHGASIEKAEIIARKIRALNPEPGVYTIQNGKRLKLLEVKNNEGGWVITKTQVEGKNPQKDRIILS